MGLKISGHELSEVTRSHLDKWHAGVDGFLGSLVEPPGGVRMVRGWRLAGLGKGQLCPTAAPQGLLQPRVDPVNLSQGF